MDKIFIVSIASTILFIQLQSVQHTIQRTERGFPNQLVTDQLVLITLLLVVATLISFVLSYVRTDETVFVLDRYHCRADAESVVSLTLPLLLPQLGQH